LLLSQAPSGKQLDSDSILDIRVSSGNTLTFDVVLNTSGVDAGASILRDLRYFIRWDPTELSLVSPTVDIPEKFEKQNTIINPNRALIAHLGAKQPLGNVFLLDTFTFNVLNPGLEPHDGRFDFRINAVRAISQTGSDLSSLFTFGSTNNLRFQEVEVQAVPEPSSILGILAFGTLGAGSLRKRQQKRLTKHLAKVAK
jgi:hypothetical protein